MLRDLWHRWLGLARKIGNFQSRIILTLFYFIIVTPFGLAVRAFSDPLRTRRPAGSQHSDWEPRSPEDPSLAAARRQF